MLAGDELTGAWNSLYSRAVFLRNLKAWGAVGSQLNL